MEKNKLERLIDASEPGEAEKIVERIKNENEGGEYSEMVAMMLNRLEEITIHQIKGYGGNDNERLWNAVGRLQAVELMRGWIYNRAADFEQPENEE